MRLSSSWCMTFGGENGSGVALLTREGEAIIKCSFDASGSRWTTVGVICNDDDFLPICGAGEMLERKEHGVYLLDTELVMAVNEQRFSIPTDISVDGCFRVVSETYRLVPTFGSSDSHTLVTVVFRLLRQHETRLCSPYTSGIIGGVGHLGFALVDMDAFSERMDGAVHNTGCDALTILGTTEIGSELLEEGKFIPVWGMRSWPYRILPVTPSSCAALVGARRGSLRTFARPSLCKAYEVLSIAELKNWRNTKHSVRPSIMIPDNCHSVTLGLYMAVGREPLAPDWTVGTLPTITVEFGEGNSSGISEGFDVDDPFEVDASAVDEGTQFIRLDCPAL